MANKSWLYPMSQRFFGEKQNNDDDDKVEILDKQEVNSTKSPDEFEVFNNMVMKRNQLLQQRKIMNKEIKLEKSSHDQVSW